MRRLILVLAALSFAAPAFADSQLERYVERQARWLGVDTSAETLTVSQLYAIKAVIDSRGDTSLAKKNQIRAIINRQTFRFGL